MADCSPVLKRRPRLRSRLSSVSPRYSAAASWNSATRCILTWELDWVALGIGFVIAAVVGILSIKLVSWLVKKDRYKIFGVYTAVLGAACVAAGLWEHISGNTLHSLLMG